MDYFKDREERKKHAVEHTEKMGKQYADDIYRSATWTKVYGGPDSYPYTSRNRTEEKEPEVVVYCSNSVVAASEPRHGKTAILNFASYKNPGGMFYEGSAAQEESLCHASFLYNILQQFDDTYYEWNRNHKNRALYTDRALYSPRVIFEYHGDKYTADVITCAAPNYGAATKWAKVPAEENRKALAERIRFIKMIAEENEVDTLILGAYGCGVFKQNPTEVAGIFKEVFAKTKVKTLVFPIPDDKNLEAFRKILG